MYPKPKIITREEWGAKAPDLNYMFQYNATDLSTIYWGIAVHHEADVINEAKTNIPALLRNIQQGHINNGWGDIGYHFLIDGLGNIYEGRLLKYRGCHVADNNTGLAGICFMGNYEVEGFPESAKQLQAGIDLMSWLCDFLSLTTANIHGHNFWNATACPGKNVSSKLPAMITEIHNKLEKPYTAVAQVVETAKPQSTGLKIYINNNKHKAYYNGKEITNLELIARF